jgi:DNA-directed RNA polymerase subunit beta
MVERKMFGKLKPVIQPPDLIAIQTQSYQDFLQIGIAPSKREKKGLQAIFHEVFPIDSYDGRYTLDFVKYDLGEPKCDALTALADGSTFAAPLHATFRLKDGDEIREEDVYMGEIPLMTRDGSFVINGAERVIVSQLHRSPGICSEQAIHPNGQILYSVRLIPDRGSWIEIQFDSSDIMWVYMDRRRRRRKFYATTFLRALGYGTDEDILKLFYTEKMLDVREQHDPEELEYLIMKDDLVDVESQAVLARRYDPITPALLDQIASAGFDRIRGGGRLG